MVIVHKLGRHVLEEFMCPAELQEYPCRVSSTAMGKGEPAVCLRRWICHRGPIMLALQIAFTSAASPAQQSPHPLVSGMTRDVRSGSWYLALRFLVQETAPLVILAALDYLAIIEDVIGGKVPLDSARRYSGVLRRCSPAQDSIYVPCRQGADGEKRRHQ